MSSYGSEILGVQPLELVDRSIGKPVTIITSVGNEYEGILQGFDSAVNCVLNDAIETNVVDTNFRPMHHKTILINGGCISLILPNQED